MRLVSFRYVFHFLLLASILLVSSCGIITSEKPVNKLQSKIDSLKTVYAPDKRIALWDISISKEDDTINVTGELDNKDALKEINDIIRNYSPVKNKLKVLPENDDRIINGIVNNSVINIRSNPTHRAEITTQILLGTPVKILKKEGGWFLIQTPNKYIGWVDAPAVVSMSHNEISNYKESQKIVYNQQYGFSYSKPDEYSQTISDLVVGCILPVISSERNYYMVQYPDKRIAWVKRSETISFEALINRQLKEDELVLTAGKFLGIPYLWGGTSSKAIDCSGFTSSVYYMNGTILQRDASQQIKYGKVVTSVYESKDLRIGDLLFFGRRATESTPEKITHVGMYIGDTEFIHASGRVKINSIDSTRNNFDPGYVKSFVRATRVIDEPQTFGIQEIRNNDFYKEIINFSE